MASDLATLGADVEWPDAEAAAEARSAEHGVFGRLAELVEWLAGVQGAFAPTEPSRPRCVVVGSISSAVAGLAESLGVGVRSTETEPDLDVPAALSSGASVADDEVDAGADLLIIAAPGPAPVAAVVVSLLTGAEPAALLPRGVAAIDTTAWITLAERMRDTRRAVAGLRNSPDELLKALDDPPFAATTGLVLRAAARRTPVVLDGTAAVVAALLGYDVQPRAARWWQIADTGTDPVHMRAVAALTGQPLLDLSTAGDGLAGLLTVPLLRAAAAIASTR